MLISEAKKLLFVHIQKTGGNSISHVLRRAVPDIRPLLRKHERARAGKARLGDAWDDYFSFAFVRNPWDRMVSWWAMVHANTHGRPAWKRLIKGRVRNNFWRYIAERADTFEDFCLKCPDTVAEQNLYFNQVDFLTDTDGVEIVGHVGRFETLDRDAAAVFERIGLGGVALPHRNVGKHRHYSTYYTDRARDAVAEGYARDIARFGYEFEDRRR